MTKSKKQKNKNEGVIHIDITENKKETNRDTLNNLIEEFPDDTTSEEMEECLNDEDDDEQRKTAANKNEGVIHRDIT